jgi:membrane-bound lytic murein transglycosylase MltF
MRWIASAVAVAALTACGSVEPQAPANTSVAVPALSEIPRNTTRPATGDSDMRLLEPFTGDLEVLMERGVIRVLAASSRTHFEVDGSMQRGRTVDAAAAFEQFVNQRLAPRKITVVVLPAAEASLINDVRAGQGDIAANVLRTFERDDQVAFAKPFRTGVRELVVTAPGTPPLVSLEDIGGRTIPVRRDSDHHSSAVRLNEQLKKIDRPPARLVLAPESSTDEDLLELVNAGRAPATIVDDYIYDAWRPRYGQAAVNRDVAVSQDGELAWVTRKDSPRLLELVNEFFSTHRLTF